MNEIGFLSARGWLDEDGYHVWQAHDCKGGRIASKLPYPMWKAIDGKIRPSVMCDECGLHAFIELGEPEA